MKPGFRVRVVGFRTLQEIEGAWSPADFASLLERMELGETAGMSDANLRKMALEEYADLSLHEGMFDVASVLYAAFPRVFPQPDAVHVTLEVTATNEAGQDILNGSLHESLLVRLLADGMDDSSVLHRVFEAQLERKSFPEADAIVWIVHVDSRSKSLVTIQITSSGYWLDPLRGTQSYDSSAYPDEVEPSSPG